MTPRIARTPRRQLSTTQLTFSVTARTTRQMPRTVKKMTDRRRPLIMPSEYVTATRPPRPARLPYLRRPSDPITTPERRREQPCSVIQLMSNSYQARP